MKALIPVDVNLSSSRLFSNLFQSVKFNIHVCMGLFLEVVWKCNTCCQSRIESKKLIEKNRDMAFRSIIKLCYKCHPSREMEFMHTYYYPGNSKGSAYPFAWKQYCLSFFNLFQAIKFKKVQKTCCTVICEVVAFPILPKCCIFCPTVLSRSGWAKVMQYVVLDAAVWPAWRP